MSLIELNETQENQFIDHVRIGISVPLSDNLVGCTALRFSRSRAANADLERREMAEMAVVPLLITYIST